MINKIKRLFFQKISKTDKPLAKLAKINIQIKNWSSRGKHYNRYQQISENHKDISKILISTNIKYLKGTGEILGAYNPPELSQGDRNQSSDSMTNNDIKIATTTTKIPHLKIHLGSNRILTEV